MADICTWVGISVAGLVAVAFIYRKLSAPNSRPKAYPNDTVVLHQIGRGPWAPSLSPFPTKLETYLRMAKIPYVSDHKNGMSSKSKTPWITYNGEDVADSQLCMEFLNKKLDVDLSSHLTPGQRAVAHAFQILADEHLYWIIVLWRWVFDDKAFLLKAFRTFVPAFMPMSLFVTMVRRQVRNQTHGQGLGRHTFEEFVQIGEKDLRTLSDAIGTKPYLMGEQPCEQDCSVFAQLVQIIYHMPTSPHHKCIQEKYPNLRDYCMRMKEKFWPDWDDCITHDYTRTATN